MPLAKAFDVVLVEAVGLGRMVQQRILQKQVTRRDHEQAIFHSGSRLTGHVFVEGVERSVFVLLASGKPHPLAEHA